ncbi:MAG TPA: thiamine pyrophosphate-dependent enzyme [Xanthobacteraceae bacterium]|nr:thiamine pyrophosphate-dependent enzyme [Xanthobacteraceae bacterium]
MPLMSGGDAVVKSLLAHGVSTVYALPGVQSDHLFNAFFDAGDAIRVVHTRHEQGAAYMALGAALATGRPAAYSVVPGPGFLNASAALATAFSTGAKVLALIGQIPSRAIGKGFGFLHEIPDQLGILRTLTKWAERVGSPAAAPGLVAQAMQTLQSGRPRPVALELPPDMLGAKAEVTLAAPLAPATPAPLDEDAIAQAATALDAAECPVIFVGGGALDAAPEVQALAERLAAPVVGFRRGKGVLDNRHVLSHALPGGHALWAKADVVLAVGTRMFLPLSAWGMDDKLKIIKVDIDPAEFLRMRAPVSGIAGDAAAVLRRLDAHLVRRASMDKARVAASRALKERIAADFHKLGVILEFLRAIRDVLPDDGVLIDELTQVGYAARTAYEARGPRTFISSGYQGTLGWGIATALGAKHALGRAPVVALSGDGGFMFNVQELATAVRHRIPIVAILFNDGAYGNVRNMQKKDHGNRVIGSDLANPDFMRLADSFGIGGYRVKDPPGLRKALEQALAKNEPAIIEVPCGDLPDPWQFIDMPKLRGT